MKKLKIISFGAGAIGSYIGGTLALAEHEVSFIERPEVIPQLSQQGIILHTKTGTSHVNKVKFFMNLGDAFHNHEYDIALVAVKSYDTQNLVSSLLPYKINLPPLLCLQNGVENEGIYRSNFGNDKVISASVTSAINRLAIGEIVVETERGIGIANEHPLALTLYEALSQAGIKTRLYAHAESMKWSKLLTNLLANASSAILDFTPYEIFSNPYSCQIEILQIKEALQVMESYHYQVVDLPSTPVRLLMAIIRSLPLKLSQPILVQFVGKGRGNKMPSLHIDLSQGKKESEVNFLNGAVVRYGEKAGVKTTVNQFLKHTLLQMVSGEIAPNIYRHNPQKLWTDI
ncbi:MAG: ketopantoate reductase family protein, partial [Anaerolineales bacterium]